MSPTATGIVSTSRWSRHGVEPFEPIGVSSEIVLVELAASRDDARECGRSVVGETSRTWSAGHPQSRGVQERPKERTCQRQSAAQRNAAGPFVVFVARPSKSGAAGARTTCGFSRRCPSDGYF